MARFRGSIAVGLAALVSAGCEPDEAGSAGTGVAEASAAISWGGFPTDGPTTTNTPIGIALEIDQGAGVPLKVRAGQRVYIDQIDVRAAIDTSSDEGVDGLADAGDFASLDWDDVELEDESFVGQASSDGTFTRRRFFRGADWMDKPSFFLIEQVDQNGHITTFPLLVGTGLEQLRTPLDSFFIRRLRAIQWTNDCQSMDSCDGATSFTEEALVELRSANGSSPSFKLQPSTTALRVRWTLKPNAPYTIPVEQVAAPAYDYGFTMDLAAITPPAPDGTYAPGQAVTFQFTLKDGAGNRLHDPGVMPSYADFLAGNIDSGIQYYRALAEPYATYYGGMFLTTVELRRGDTVHTPHGRLDVIE